MAEWLDDEWLAGVAELASARPAVPGANGCLSISVANGRVVHGAYHWCYKDGVAAGGGPGTKSDAEVVLTITREDAEAVASGEVEPSVAFMRGRLKASGDGGLLIGWLESTAGEEYAAWRAKVVAAVGEGPPA